MQKLPKLNNQIQIITSNILNTINSGLFGVAKNANALNTSLCICISINIYAKSNTFTSVNKLDSEMVLWCDSSNKTGPVNGATRQTANREQH